MNSRISLILTGAATLLLVSDSTHVLGRGFAGGGGGRVGGGGVRGGGSFSPSSGSGSGRGNFNSGSGNFSRPSAGDGDFSASSGGSFERPAQLPSGREANVSGGRLPSVPVTRPSGGDRPAVAGDASQLPSSSRPGGGNPPAARPGGKDAGNFLGVAGSAAAGVAAGSALANRPAQLPANRSGFAGQHAVGSRIIQRPEDRPNWNNWSQNRNNQWQQRVDNQHDAWTNWQQKKQDRLTNFRHTQEQRWDMLQHIPEGRRISRNQNREQWQQHRTDLWNYRYDRADEIRSAARDHYNHYFDDRWWGACRWTYGFGYVGFGNYPANPWWWWTPCVWARLIAFYNGLNPIPIYIDYGNNVIYDGDTVYVDDQPVPAAQYSEPMTDLAVNVEQPSPPAPPAEGQQAEWLPLGVYALAQEEKGEPIMFMQLSVNRAGVISGAYSSTLTNDQRPIAGQVDKASQRAAWRIGANTDTIFVSSLANLTQDVSPVVIQFGNTRTQTWLLVRMPEPAPAGQPGDIPEIDRTLPPLNGPAAAPK